MRYVCGETAFCLFLDAVCVHVSSALFSAPNGCNAKP